RDGQDRPHPEEPGPNQSGDTDERQEDEHEDQTAHEACRPVTDAPRILAALLGRPYSPPPAARNDEADHAHCQRAEVEELNVGGNSRHDAGLRLPVTRVVAGVNLDRLRQYVARNLADPVPE